MILAARSLGFLLLILVVSLLPTGGTASSATPHAAGSPLVTIKVAMLPYISFAPFYIAQDEGYFAQQGLKVELVNLADQVDIIPALSSGQVDVSSGLISAGVLNTIAQGSKIQIVADKGYIAPKACDTYALVASRGLIQFGIAGHLARLRGAAGQH
jgi:NitT/TauT family transport system substrate-binding protein